MMIENKTSNLQEKMVQELRRGVLALAVLSQLKTAQYGYSLISKLSQKGLEIDQGTLYPLLRRLEADGLLESAWNTEGARPRRYYIIGTLGSEFLELLIDEWRDLTQGIDQLLTESLQRKEDHHEPH